MVDNRTAEANTTNTTIPSTSNTSRTSTVTPYGNPFQSTFNIEYFDKHKCSWTRWVERLENVFLIYGTPEIVRASLLLHYIGQDTYNTLCDKLTPEKPVQKSYAELVKLLENHFEPKPLEIVENYRFHLRKQQDGENIEEYLVNLRKLSLHCNFGAYLETALRNQFVFGLKSQKMLSRLLETPNLTLQLAVEKAKAMELSESGGAEISKAQQSVHQVEQKGKRHRKYKGKKQIRNNNSENIDPA